MKMPPRGKHGKFKLGNKKGFKTTNSKYRKRKTFSIFQSNNKNVDFKQGNKRKYDSTKHNPKNLHYLKKQKTFDGLPQLLEKSSSESEEEIEDHMKQLRNTFVGINKQNTAIDSDDTESSVEEDNDLKEEFSSNDDSDSISSDVSNLDEEISDNEDSDGNSVVENEEFHEKNLDDEITEDNELILETAIEDDSDNFKDPFVKHLLYDLNDSLLNSVQSLPMVLKSHNENWPQLGKLTVQIPHCDETKTEEPISSIVEKKVFTSPGTVPTRIHANKDTLTELNVKIQIVGNLVRANKSLSGDEKNKSVPLTPLQSEIFSVINNYQDFYFPQRTFENAEEIRFVYCLHAINHILKTRSKVLHHNARLSKKDDVPEEFRDQGLVRPKIMIIVPFRDAAYKIIQLFIEILITEDKGNVINRNRFVEEFTGNELSMPKKNPKPEDYEQTFCGNSNDDFKIGITVTKKSLKLYSDFYSSDIIIASPLGLRYTIGAEGEAERDYDFLASIELLIFDQTEIFLMQNWDHVVHILNHLHLQPKDSHGTDFSRVRTWSLNGWAKYYRQTLIFSSILLPEINSVFNRRCANHAGRVKVVNEIQFGTIRQVFVQLPHVFQKINANSVEHAIEARFNYFISKVLTQQRDTLMKQTMIYVTSYFDYVRLRNYFKREDISFVQICEYSKMGKIARARDMFFHGDAHFLLYTERYHFFNRIRVKGIRHLVFYQPPNFPNFYYEICNLMQVKFTYRGPIAPVFTPFNNDSGKTLNLELIPNYVKFLADNGIRGILVQGTTGEGMSLNVEQRKLLAEKWLKVGREAKLHVMIQVGGAPLPDVIELAKHAEKIGADSLLCLPELYLKPTTADQLIRYLKIVGNAAPNTPLLYYHIPMFTNVNIHMGEFLNEVDDKIANFVGIKFTSEVLDEGLEALRAHNGKFAVFLGADTLMLKAYTLGFDSAIATTLNIFPKMGISIYEDVKSGKVEEARPIQEKLSKAVAAIIKHGTWVPTMKEAMNLLTPIKVGPPRDPITPLTKEQSKEIYDEITSLKL